MIDFITKVCSKITSTAATSATAPIPLDSADTVPKYVALKATAAGYVRISSDSSAASSTDVLITPGDSLRMCTNKRSYVSFVAVSGNSTLQIEPLEFGGYQFNASDYLSLSAPLSSSLAASGGSATFTRSTTATVVDQDSVVRTANINEARFQGLRRVENLWPSSSDLSGATLTAVSVTSSVIPLTIDSTNLQKLVEAAGYNANYAVARSLTVAAGTRLLMSTYVYAPGRTRFMLEFWGSGGGQCIFNPTDGTISSTNTGYSGASGGVGAISAVVGVSGMFRVSFAVNTVGTTVFAQIRLLDNAGASGYSTDGTSGVYVGGTMVENVSGQIVSSNPSEYVSNGVLSAPFHGAGVDGVKYFNTTLAGAPLSGKFLSEPARTNLLTYSDQFDNAAWVKNGTASVTPNTFVAPDGVTSGDTLSLPSGLDRITNSPTSITGGSVYVFSAWLSGFGTINLTLSTSGGTYTYGSNLITLTSTPTRYQFALLTVVGNTGMFCVIGRYDGIGSSGTSTSVNIFGAQLEVGNKASSYIPTVGATVTRAADSLTYPVTMSTNQGGLCYTIVPAESPSTTTTYPNISLLSVSNSNHIGIRTDPVNNDLLLFVYTGGSFSFQTVIASVAAGSTYKVAITWSVTSGTLSYSVNGAAVTLLTGKTIPSGLNTFTANDVTWNGQVSDVKVFTQLIPNETLRQLTT